jgi:hypothetical protein
MTVEQSNHSNLKASIISIPSLTPSDRERMFELMQGYYDRVSREKFLADLSNKNDVILLRDPEGRIQGFSTLRIVSLKVDGKTLRGVFSGDTVIERAFWGQRALGKAFLRYLFHQKIRRPFQPLYWLLISKGYKTYLMMANNFSEHYPRYECPTPPDVKTSMDAFYSFLFADYYDPQEGVIRMSTDRLKEGVAEISGEEESNPRIAFFQRANPRWREGVELACIARMTLWMPAFYAIKVFLIDRVTGSGSRFHAESVKKERTVE